MWYCHKHKFDRNRYNFWTFEYQHKFANLKMRILTIFIWVILIYKITQFFFHLMSFYFSPFEFLVVWMQHFWCWTYNIFAHFFLLIFVVWLCVLCMECGICIQNNIIHIACYSSRLFSFACRLQFARATYAKTQ